MISGDFEWDVAKAAENLVKHGISFDEAAAALAGDPFEVAFEDIGDRLRTVSLVMSPRVRVLFVVSAERSLRTRIISARKADPHEQRAYAQSRR